MALVTIQDVKDFLKLPDGNAEDNFLSQLIAAAQGEMEQIHHRSYEYQADFVEVISGIGGKSLFLKHFPILSVSQVTVDGNVIAPDQYEVDSQRGILVGYWGKGVENISVTYTGGYWTDLQNQPPSGVPVIPFDIRHECLERVAYLYQNRGGYR